MMRIRTTTIAIFVLLAAAAPARAQAPGAGATSGDTDDTVLHVSETARRQVPQDRLTVELRADVTGPDAGQVQATINRRMATALERAKGVPAVRTETRGYWVQQERPANAAPRWHGVETVALIGTDTAAVLKLAGSLQQAGLVMSRLTYDVAPATMKAAEDDLTSAALQRLKERVDHVAKDMGLVQRNFRDLRVGNVGGNPPPPRPLMGARADIVVPVAEPGETTLEVVASADVVLSRNPP
jgi:predicted secreted protein